MQQISRDVLQVQQGSLYPAPHRLENRGWLRAERDESDSGRDAKVYTLTKAGRKQLEVSAGCWRCATSEPARATPPVSPSSRICAGTSGLSAPPRMNNTA